MTILNLSHILRRLRVLRNGDRNAPVIGRPAARGHRSGGPGWERISRRDWRAVVDVRYGAAPLGAEISGLDLTKPLGTITFRAIEDVLHDRGVVVFRDQQLTEAQHVAFSRRFGELEIHVAKQHLKPGYPEILVLSNVIENGRSIGVRDGGQNWHSDLSYVANPSRCSLLYALEIPVQDGRVLGGTLFASAVHAYETLPGPLKMRLEGARAVHRYADRYKQQQETTGREPLGEEQLKRVPDVS